jgi:hypothetical protein
VENSLKKGQSIDQQKCALCYENTDLKLSHIVPKFVFSFIKRTSVTGKFRDPTDFKIRKQDGPKYRLLCGSCEQLLSESEKYFAEKVFIPYVNNENVNIKYDHKLQYYIESAHWRFLLTQMNSYESEQQKILKDIEISIRSKLRFQKMKDVLVLLQLDYPNYPRWTSHFLYYMDARLISLLSDEIDYFKRMVICDLFFYKKRVYIYSYYCGLVICSVFNCRKIDFLNFHSHLVRKKGKFKLKKVNFNNIVISHLLLVKHRGISESLENVSKEEREEFQKLIEKGKNVKSRFTK